MPLRYCVLFQGLKTIMKYSLNPQVTRNLAKRHEGEPATEMQCAVTQISNKNCRFIC